MKRQCRAPAQVSLNKIAKALTNLTISYDKRLAKNINIIAGNTKLLDKNARSREENASHLKAVNDDTVMVINLGGKWKGRITE